MGFIVAIDGTAGSGKGTVTKQIAKDLNLMNIDTGAMYRCVALEAIKNNVEPVECEELNKILNDINIDFKTMENGEKTVLLNGEDVSKNIRTPEVDSVVAKYAALKSVRDKMTPLQRKIGENNDIIMEGRDIGTVVFPNADVKIYLDASVEERARRRYVQDIESGLNVTYEEVLESIKQRHILETQREIAPLVKADDAVFVDSTNLTIDEVVETIEKIINSKRGNK